MTSAARYADDVGDQVVVAGDSFELVGVLLTVLELVKADVTPHTVRKLG